MHVEFTGTYRGKEYVKETAILVKGPNTTQKGTEITVLGTSNPNLPQKQFRVVLRDAHSFRAIGGDEAQEQHREETEAEIQHRLERRFHALKKMTAATALGVNKGLVVSGPAGLGKSYTVEESVRAAEASDGITVTTIKGFVRATGLYKTLYENRNPGSVIVFDDADSVLLDDVSLNLLKSALDTTDERWLHWSAETRMETEDGEPLPRSFEFQGQVIFITNIDFEQQIEKGTKLAPHLEALLSRSHYLDLDIRTKKDYIVRIKQVLSYGMLRKEGLNREQEAEVIEFIETNSHRLRELSLRMAHKIGTMLKMDPAGWRDLAEMTVFKGRSRR